MVAYASGLTTQAQRRRPRDAPIATAMARRRSLQRMVRPCRCHHQNHSQNHPLAHHPNQGSASSRRARPGKAVNSSNCPHRPNPKLNRPRLQQLNNLANFSTRRHGLTTQAQRPGARDATIATAMLPPGSLQRMVRPLVSYTQTKPLRSPHPRCKQPLT